VKAFQSQDNQIKQSGSLVNVGNFLPKKNQSFIVDILSILLSKGVKSNLTFVGDGITRQEVEARAKEQKLEELVVFKGKTDDVKAILLDNSIYVHSAHYEPFGLVLLEAMAAGLPVVSLDGLGNRDIIQDGINGFLIDQGDENRFVKCIINLINDLELYQKIQQEGYKTAYKYDIQPYVDQLLELYKSKS
jgi:glycosyltransferase EpsD